MFIELAAERLTTDDLAAYGDWLGLASTLSLLSDERVLAKVGPVEDLSRLMNIGPRLSEEFGFRPGVRVTSVSMNGELLLGLRLPEPHGGFLLTLLALVRDWTATRGELVTAALQTRLYSQLEESGVPVALRAVTSEFVEQAPLPIVDVRLG